MSSRFKFWLLIAPLAFSSMFGAAIQPEVAAKPTANTTAKPAIAAKTAAKPATAIKKSIPIVYDFSASYCVPCKVIKPIFEEVQKEYKGRVDMQEIDAEDEKNKELVDKYQATAFPLIVFVDAQGKRVGEFNRKITKKELVDRIEKLLAK